MESLVFPPDPKIGDIIQLGEKKYCLKDIGVNEDEYSSFKIFKGVPKESIYEDIILKFISESKYRSILYYRNRVRLSADINPSLLQKYLGYGKTKGFFGIAATYAEGKDLNNYFSETISFERLFDIIFCVRELIKTSFLLKDFNIVHSDIKPSNAVFLDEPINVQKMNNVGKEQYSVGLIDIDSIDCIGNDTQFIIGTPLYLAPEVCCGKFSSSCDIYSVGMTALSILNNEEIYRKLEGSFNIELNEIMRKKVYNEFLPPSLHMLCIKYAESLDEQLVQPVRLFYEFVFKALKHNWQERPQSEEEALAIFDGKVK